MLLSDSPVKLNLLTGSTKVKDRKIINQSLKMEHFLLIGTHAIFEENVRFKNLGLAIIDEQHRLELHREQNYGQKIVFLPIYL